MVLFLAFTLCVGGAVCICTTFFAKAFQGMRYMVLLGRLHQVVFTSEPGVPCWVAWGSFMKLLMFYPLDITLIFFWGGCTLGFWGAAVAVAVAWSLVPHEKGGGLCVGLVDSFSFSA